MVGPSVQPAVTWVKVRNFAIGWLYHYMQILLQVLVEVDGSF